MIANNYSWKRKRVIVKVNFSVGLSEAEKSIAEMTFCREVSILHQLDSIFVVRMLGYCVVCFVISYCHIFNLWGAHNRLLYFHDAIFGSEQAVQSIRCTVSDFRVGGARVYA